MDMSKLISEQMIEPEVIVVAVLVGAVIAALSLRRNATPTTFGLDGLHESRTPPKG